MQGILTKPIFIGLKLSNPEKRALDVLAKREGLNQSEALRLALREAVERRKAAPVTYADMLAREAATYEPPPR